MTRKRQRSKTLNNQAQKTWICQLQVTKTHHRQLMNHNRLLDRTRTTSSPEHSRPSRNRNPPPRLNYWGPGNPVTNTPYLGNLNTFSPPPRLNYWTPGNPVTNIPYFGNLNTISGFAEPWYSTPIPATDQIPYLRQPNHVPYYPFTFVGPHCPYCGTMF